MYCLYCCVLWYVTLSGRCKWNTKLKSIGIRGTRRDPVPGNNEPNIQETRTAPVPGSGEPNIQGIRTELFRDSGVR